MSTNLNLLQAVLDKQLRAGDARTTLLRTYPTHLHRDSGPSASLVLLQQQARTLGIGLLPNKPVNQGAGLEVEEGTRGVECPMNGSSVDVSVALGQIAKAGESLMVISAMKMEQQFPLLAAEMVSTCRL